MQGRLTSTSKLPTGSAADANTDLEQKVGKTEATKAGFNDREPFRSDPVQFSGAPVQLEAFVAPFLGARAAGVT